MKPIVALVLAVSCAAASAQTGTDQTLNTCKQYLEGRSNFDANIIGLFSGQVRKDLEETNIWLDQYCPAHPNEHIAIAVSKRRHDSRSNPE